eukprot:TRINITY_DN796_c0_g1_i5.p6 TRINITY_DN796_c0_g1~~TRINITY_DN796_c0_g1_i5.p6  ORF type:complete len:114 (-),score=0.39 TRINITY_DN796_c0_g1_i5:1069-1410(-)
MQVAIDLCCSSLAHVCVFLTDGMLGFIDSKRYQMAQFIDQMLHLLHIEQPYFVTVVGDYIILENREISIIFFLAANVTFFGLRGTQGDVVQGILKHFICIIICVCFFSFNFLN